MHVRPHRNDPYPNALIENQPAALHRKERVCHPYVRADWLRDVPDADAGRRSDAYVRVSCDEALDLVAGELRCVQQAHGPVAVFGGSNGWSGAGSFHYASSQIHCFLASARGDYNIFADLAAREEFTEGRARAQWLRHLYGTNCEKASAMGHAMSDVDPYWQCGGTRLPHQAEDGGIMQAFRNDPVQHPQPTPTGKIQITTAHATAFGYVDCPGQPTCPKPEDAPTPHCPLLLLANQPASRRHSQLDFGAQSVSTKRGGRQVCMVHPDDATARSSAESDTVLLHNCRGACLASATLSDAVLRSVVQLPNGAWFDPHVDSDGWTVCVQGNPNAVTRDKGTLSLAQGCVGQLTAVLLQGYDAPVPAIHVFDPPAMV